MVYPLESQITWHTGFNEMVPYTFGPNRITHSFCSVCGTSIGGKTNAQDAFGKYRALNVSVTDVPHGFKTLTPLQIRTLRGVDLDNLKIRRVDTRADKVTNELD